MVDNNASYPLPTELTTNATYNFEAEQEYDTEKTGKCYKTTVAELH